MAAQRRDKKQALKSSNDTSDQQDATTNNENTKDAERATERAQIAEEHLPPLLLIFTVMACSGLLWVFALRDLFATGRIIAGSWDEAMLLFTKSLDFFDNTNGWRSQQGGLSSIQKVTTDANNMGGLFVRKVGGAVALAVHTQKLLPLLFHPEGAKWNMGHFRPLLWTAVVGNVCIIALYALYMEDFASAAADTLPKVFIGAMIVETLVMMYYLITQKRKGRAPAIALPEGKTPTSVTSRIVTRTVLMVSGFMTLIAARDLFFPGHILDFIPRDDIYLEWTGALLHSPPEGSQEAHDQGLQAPLYVADKFLSQYMALHILILCLYKFVTALVIRLGADGSGEIMCKMIWKGQMIGDSLMLFLFRLFVEAAKSASLDLRWHLVMFGYETCILGLYAFY